MSSRTAFISGAGKRIGAALAKGLAAKGYDLVLHANRSMEDVESVADGVRTAFGVRVSTDACDFSDPEATKVFAERLIQNHPIDLLINNASLFENDRLPNVSDDCFERHMAVNFHAPRHLMTAFFQSCTKAGREGHIINMLDHKLKILNPDFFSYTMSKAALGTMTKTCAMQFAPHVRVNSISPGIALISGKQTQADFEASWASAPMRRSATPDQIVNAALFLDQSPSIHGEDIIIDGGQALYHLPRDIAFLSKHGVD